MTTVRLDLEYDGRSFAGWAAQPNERTVEGVLRDALARVVRGDVADVRVAGRTDAGVSATGQVVSLVVPPSTDLGGLRDGLNGTLPEDVAVRDVSEAPVGFDARGDATSRRYTYRLLTGPPSPLRRAHVLHVRGRVDVAAMQLAAIATCGQHDFTAFTPTQTQHVFFERTVLHCDWQEVDDELIFTIEADAFLRHMVRVLVGTMLQVGRGARSQEQFVSLLEGVTRDLAGPTAPAHPLTLVHVGYPPRETRA